VSDRFQTEVMAPGTGPRFRGPASVPLLGWRLRGLQLLRDPPKFFLSLYERYGEVCAWDPNAPRQVFVATGRYIKLLLTDPDTFGVDGFRVMKLPAGSAMAHLARGVLSLNGEEHHHHRRLMAPAFRRHRFAHHIGTIADTIRSELDRWKVGELRRLDIDLMRMVTFISIRTMFGVEDPHRLETLYRSITHLLKYTGTLGAVVLPYNIPGFSFARMLAAAEVVERDVRLFISEKRRAGATGDDVLSVLVATHDQEGSGLADDELVGDAYTVLCHSTIASALQWTLILLDQHRDAADALVDEINSVVAGDAPTLRELERLPLLEAVLKESMRLFPPSSISRRYAERDCMLGAYNITRGTEIYFSHFVTHRIASVFPRPLKFEPERWLGAGEPSPYDYAPFGAGPHICVAKHFSMEEMKIMLAMILKRVQLSLPPDTRIDRGLRISLIPRNGLTMRVNSLDRKVGRSRVVGNIHESVDLD
jgi:cytochrome P450